MTNCNHDWSGRREDWSRDAIVYTCTKCGAAGEISNLDLIKVNEGVANALMAGANPKNLLTVREIPSPSPQGGNNV